MDKRKQIEDIMMNYDLGHTDTELTINAILLLFDVSGNEANPNQNKKDGEVAVAFADYELNAMAEKIYKYTNQSQHRPYLYGFKLGFQTAKATDR